MSVEIKIYGDTAREALVELLGLADGLSPETGNLSPALGPVVGASVATGSQDCQQALAVTADKPAEAPAEPEAEAPKRERGKPSPGRARRTKEEIAEDDAADAAEASAPVTEPVANISTGEERTNPEEEAQDAADEAADPANAPGAESTRDDVRKAMMAYSQKFDMARLTADMSAILKDHWPDGSVTKLSEIPEDAAAFAAVIGELQARMAEG